MEILKEETQIIIKDIQIKDTIKIARFEYKTYYTLTVTLKGEDKILYNMEYLHGNGLEGVTFTEIFLYLLKEVDAKEIYNKIKESEGKQKWQD